MAKLLIVADTYNGRLGKPTLHTLTFGRALLDAVGGTFDIAVLGGGASGLAAELTGFGADHVYTVEHPSLESYTAEVWAAALADLVKATGATHVAGAATTLGKDLLPRTAGLLDAGMAAEVLAVQKEADGTISYKRPMWAGNIVATVVVDTPVHVLSVRPTEFAAAEPTGGSSAVTAHAYAPSGDAKTRFVSYESSGGERPDLGEADRVVAGGRGLKDEEGFKKILDPLADTLGAAIGATRAAVDSGFAPNDLQIGQTGRVVAPDLYIAVGISGAIQHVAGMKASKCIVAVNKDPEAPIFQIADYGLVADAFKVVPELLEKIG